MEFPVVESTGESWFVNESVGYFAAGFSAFRQKLEVEGNVSGRFRPLASNFRACIGARVAPLRCPGIVPILADSRGEAH